MVDKAKRSRHLRAVQDQTLSENRSLEDLKQESLNTTTYQAGIPVAWNDPRSGRSIRGRNALVQAPTAGELRSFSTPPRAVCGNCRYFDLHHGRREIVNQRFAERLVEEEQWGLRHLGVPFDHIGLCGQSDGELATSLVSKACDHFRDSQRGS